MNYWTLSLIVTACGILYYYLKKKLSYFEELGIPYLPPWFLLGNMGDSILRRKHINDIVREVYNINPSAKYVGFFDFMRPIIMLRDPDLIKSVTIKNFDNFPDHKTFVNDSLDPLFAGNLFSMTGEAWKETRNLLSPAFTSKKMKTMFDLIVDCGKNFTQYLSQQPDEARKMVATKELFTKYTNDAIATCAFGISVDTFKNPKNQFYVLGRKATNLGTLFTLKFFLSKTIPTIMKLFKIRFISSDVSSFFLNLVSTTVKTRDEKGIKRPDMLQLMMDARNKQLDMTITEMTAQAFIFFFGGFETTSAQMCIIAHLLALNQDIQKKLQDEIDEINQKSNGNPTYDAINGMLYLDAVFNETMRRYTQVGFIDRLCVKEFELPPTLPHGKPIILKPGDNIWIPAAAIHLDPKYYDNPEDFNPDRYYEKKVSINDYTNLGFGIGPRACIGNRFAILETKILFFFLLSKFNLKPNAKTCSPLRYDKSTFSVIAEGGFWLTIEPRC